MKAVYVTRDSLRDYIEVWPVTVGIRKFRGCVIWGAAWCEDRYTSFLFPENRGRAKGLDTYECRRHFGFCPRAGTAWYVNTRGKRSKVDIDFSN